MGPDPDPHGLGKSRFRPGGWMGPNPSPVARSRLFLLIQCPTHSWGSPSCGRSPVANEPQPCSRYGASLLLALPKGNTNRHNVVCVCRYCKSTHIIRYNPVTCRPARPPTLRHRSSDSYVACPREWSDRGRVSSAPSCLPGPGAGEASGEAQRKSDFTADQLVASAGDPPGITVMTAPSSNTVRTLLSRSRNSTKEKTRSVCPW